jgi:hypothetical protein
MIRSVAGRVINEEHGVRSVPIVHANFYLNRYPFYVQETDDTEPDPYSTFYTNIRLFSPENLSKTYQWGHGNVSLTLNGSSKRSNSIKPAMGSRVPYTRTYLTSQSSSYKYYLSPIPSTSGGPATNGEGFTASLGGYLGRPKIEYFDANDNSDPFPGNSVNIKWNTSDVVPTHFKVHVKHRPVDTFDTPVWEEVYDSFEDRSLHINTGERYGVKSILNTDGATTRIQLAVENDVEPWIRVGNRYARRDWEDGDYLDVEVGNNIAILGVDNSINGICKVINTNKADGWIEVYSSTEIDKEINYLDLSVEIYAIDAGELNLYRQSNGEWSLVENRFTSSNNNLVDIAGVKVDILAVSKPKSRIPMVSLCPVLAADLTEYVTALSTTEELSERSVTMPIGVLTANHGTLSLNNSEQTFDRSNIRRVGPGGQWTGSFIARLLDETAEIKSYFEVGSLESTVTDMVPATPLLVDTWENGDGFGSVTASLLDYGLVLQSRPAPDLLLQNKPVTTIVYNIMDRVGFSRVLGWPDNYAAAAAEPTIEFFWCRKEETVWEVLQKLASSTQTAIFFDRYGYLRILPVSILSDRLRGEAGKNVHTLTAVQNGDKLSNIMSISREPLVPVNKVTLKYKPAGVNGQAGQLARDTFWLPEDNEGMGITGSATLAANDLWLITTPPRLPSASSPTTSPLAAIWAGTGWGAAGPPLGTFNNSSLIANVNWGDKGPPASAMPGPTTTPTPLPVNPPPFSRMSGAFEYNNNIIKYVGTEVELRGADGGKRFRIIKNDEELQSAMRGNLQQQLVFTGRLRLKENQDPHIIQDLEDGLNNRPGSDYTYANVALGAPWETYYGDQYIGVSSLAGTMSINTNSRNTKKMVIAYRDFPSRFESVRLNFRIVEAKTFQSEGISESSFGITLFNQQREAKEQCYTVCVSKGEAVSGAGRQSTIRVKRLNWNGTWTYVHSVPGVTNDYPEPVREDEWHWLEATVWTFNETKVIEVFLDGERVGVFADFDEANGGILDRNNSAGFFAKDGGIEIGRFEVTDLKGSKPDLDTIIAQINGRKKPLLVSRTNTKKVVTK